MTGIVFDLKDATGIVRYQSELERVALYFTEKLEETAGQVARDENGVFAVPREDIFACSTQVYDSLSR